MPNEGEQDIISETSVLMTDEAGNQLITETSAGSLVNYTIQVIYNGVTYTSGAVYQDGSFTFPKNSTSEQQATVIVSTDSTVNDTIQITMSCPVATSINLYSVCVTDPADAGKYIHNEFNWTNGSTTSAVQSDLVLFGTGTTTFIVSQYTLISGGQGLAIPPDGSTVTMYSNKINFDDFVFDASLNLSLIHI